jgi:hypothetical protein
MSNQEKIAELKVPAPGVGESLPLTDHELALRAAQGFAKLWRDIHSPETLLDVAARRLEREEVNRILDGETLPGHERAPHWFDSNTNGFSDESQS